MATQLKARVVKVGNSRGIRIPKPVLEQVGLVDEVELTVESDGLVVRPKRTVQGWSKWGGKGAPEAQPARATEAQPARLVSLRGQFHEGQFELSEPPPALPDNVEVIVTFLVPATGEKN
jgi:virulence-associated protein VagC